MESSLFSAGAARFTFFSTTPKVKTLFPFRRSENPTLLSSPPSISPFNVSCKRNESEEDAEELSISSAFRVLGVDRSCSFTELKAAFRSRVKEFHPDLRKDTGDSDLMIRRVILAYELLSENVPFSASKGAHLDSFDKPECEALDVFVDETGCIGKGCPYSCVKRAPHAFSFSASTGTACATSQGHGDDYEVQLAVGQCPRSCIHYVTPSQRIVLEELLDSILSFPCNSSAEADYFYSLIAKAKFENNRYPKPKRQPKASTQSVDWF